MNKVNELDDKIVWASVLELETDGEKKKKSKWSRRQSHETRTRQKIERGGRGDADENKEKKM